MGNRLTPGISGLGGVHIWSPCLMLIIKYLIVDS